MTSLETARSLANGPEGEFPRYCSVSYLSLAMVLLEESGLWAELNGGENSLHWKANMLPLFSIMTLWTQRVTGSLVINRNVLFYVSFDEPATKSLIIDGEKREGGVRERMKDKKERQRDR